jgi:hypothetical protein
MDQLAGPGSKPIPTKKENQMKRLITLAVAFVAVAILYSATVQAQAVNRPVSQFFRWDFAEDLTSSGVPGITIYSHALVNPINPTTGVPKYNVGYLDLAVTGDEHVTSAGVPAAALFGCFINGAPCNSGGTFAGGGGFVALGKTGEDNHDNSETYHWCFALPGGANTVSLNLASDNGGTVFVEGAYVNLEAAKIPIANACTAAP